MPVVVDVIHLLQIPGSRLARLVAVATLIDGACIVLCEGTAPDAAFSARAQQLGLWVLGTDKNVYEAAKSVAALCGV